MKVFGGYIRLVHRWKWSALLALLLAGYLARPMLGESLIEDSVTSIVYTLLFIGTFHAAETARSIAPVASVVLLIGIAIEILSTLTGSPMLTLVTSVFSVFFVLSVMIVTFVELIVGSQKTADRMIGAVFGYFLIVGAFAMFYAGMEKLAPGSFILQGETEVQTQFLYFSLVTITTLGYGDILPISSFARIVSGLQAAFGSLYLAILIGRIVGQFAERERR